LNNQAVYKKKRINNNKSKMKKSVLVLISCLLLSATSFGSNLLPDSGKFQNDSIKILAGQDLFALSSVWAAEYNRLNPGAGISVRAISGNQAENNLLRNGNVGIVTSKEISYLGAESVLTAVAGRDVIVPVINSENPLLSELKVHGISAAVLGAVLSGSESPTWGALLKNDNKSLIRYYTVSDEAISEEVGSFLKTGSTKLTGIEVKSSRELISAIQKDPMAIGFCKMINIIDFTDQTIAEKISFLPIDRNENGLIDSNEDIYSDVNAFSRGIWIGKYPKSLVSNIYAVSVNPSQNTNVTAFVKWVLTDGQQYLNGIGYSDLLLSERQSAVERINNAQIIPPVAPEEGSVLKSALIVLIVMIVLVVAVELLFRLIRSRKNKVLSVPASERKVLVENSLLIPKGLYFDKTHTWAFMEQNGIIKMGIDDFLQHITGTITRIRMKNPGEVVKKGDVIMSVVHNGKQLNLYAPVSGTIIEQNRSLEQTPSLINTSPYSDGWIYRIEPTNWPRENQLLFMAEKQKQFLVNEFTRLRDFLAMSLNAGSDMYSQVVLQDGGELMDGTLSELGPEVWEDFQTKFIDPSRQLWFYEMF
jgi:glycine cleavage system H lipoate-binding protein/ABC-type phosphate transport system substrate-binding protein